MNMADRFWINFGKSIAWGILFTVVISIIELIVLSRTGKEFGFMDFFFMLGVWTLIFGFLGIVIGVADNENHKSGFTRDV